MQRKKQKQKQKTPEQTNYVKTFIIEVVLYSAVRFTSLVVFL